jgi:hypothetical protein
VYKIENAIKSSPVSRIGEMTLQNTNYDTYGFPGVNKFFGSGGWWISDYAALNDDALTIVTDNEIESHLPAFKGTSLVTISSNEGEFNLRVSPWVDDDFVENTPMSLGFVSGYYPLVTYQEVSGGDGNSCSGRIVSRFFCGVLTPDEWTKFDGDQSDINILRSSSFVNCQCGFRFRDMYKKFDDSKNPWDCGSCCDEVPETMSFSRSSFGGLTIDIDVTTEIKEECYDASFPHTEDSCSWETKRIANDLTKQGDSEFFHTLHRFLATNNCEDSEFNEDRINVAEIDGVERECVMIREYLKRFLASSDEQKIQAIFKSEEGQPITLMVLFENLNNNMIGGDQETATLLRWNNLKRLDLEVFKPTIDDVKYNAFIDGKFYSLFVSEDFATSPGDQVEVAWQTILLIVVFDFFLVLFTYR